MPAPPPPWPTRARTVVWWHRAVPGAPRPVAGALAALPVTVAAFVHYLETPVGPYDEIAASPVALLDPLVAGSIPFIAVDSADSVDGGRANWDLPKALAAFDLSGPLVGEGPDWRVAAAVRVRPRRFPLALRARVRQPGARLRVALQGTARLATVEVERAGVDWLRPGRHPAVVIDDARATFT